jgi:hypothetical protein
MSTALTPYTGNGSSAPSRAVGMVLPVASPDEAKAAITQYEALKASIITDGDVYREVRKDRDGNEKVVEYLRKRYWRRLATCFGLDLQLVSETREKDEKGALAYSVFYRAIAPNGRVVEGDGYCSRSEGGKGFWSEHSIRATAHTRAKNRAISDMVGGGEVSYEEMQGDDEAETPRAETRQANTSTNTSKKSSLDWDSLKKRAAAIGLSDFSAFAKSLVGQAPKYDQAEFNKIRSELARREETKPQPVRATVTEEKMPATSETPDLAGLDFGSNS